MNKSSSSTLQRPTYAFPERVQFERAVQSLATTLPRWAGEEGPRFRLELSPGAIRTTSTDLAKKNRTENARIEAHLRKDGDSIIADLMAAKRKSPREIKALSLKSRSRMALRLATIDYSPLFADGRIPAMLTTTMPHDWETVAPTPAAFKKIVNRFREAYRRQWGEYIAGVWKMEFQWRKDCDAKGCHDPAAPHLHVIMSPPPGTAYAPRSMDDLCHLNGCAGAGEHSHKGGEIFDACNAADCEHPTHAERYEFPEWASRAWADAVRHPDPDQRRKNERAGAAVDYDELSNYSDPKRIGIYFAKHGLFADKEYQNVMPKLWREAEGGARYWGYWVVKPMVVSKDVHEALIMHIIRHLRALADRAAYSRVVTATWTRVYEEVEKVPDGALFGTDGEIFGTVRIASHRLGQRKRKVKRRVKRWRNRCGFEVVNDSLEYVADIARIMAYHLPALSEREGYDLRLLSPSEDGPDWFDDSSPPQWGQNASVA